MLGLRRSFAACAREAHRRRCGRPGEEIGGPRKVGVRARGCRSVCVCVWGRASWMRSPVSQAGPFSHRIPNARHGGGERGAATRRLPRLRSGGGLRPGHLLGPRHFARRASGCCARRPALRGPGGGGPAASVVAAAVAGARSDRQARRRHLSPHALDISRGEHDEMPRAWPSRLGARQRRRARQ